MSNEHALFKMLFHNHPITTAVDERDDSLWFLLRELGEAWGIANIHDNATSLDSKHLRELGIPDVTGRQQKQKFVSAHGVYILAFRSRKPEAEAFTERVAEMLEKLRRGELELRPRAQALEEHTDVSRQKKNSKLYNRDLFAKGGKELTMKENSDICWQLTDKHLYPHQYKQWAKELGYKRIATGLDGVRQLEGWSACAISAAKNFIRCGIAKQDAYDLAKELKPIYARLLQLGVMPKELRQKEEPSA